MELGYAYAELDRPADAEQCFKRALELDPRAADAHAALGGLYLSVGIVDGAEHHSRRALDADFGHAPASQTLAAVLEARGEAAAAAEVLETAYRRQALFLQPALSPRLRVLALARSGVGNVPCRFIMPARFYTRLVWYMDHAREGEAPDPADYDVVFNTIGDADLTSSSQRAVARFLGDCPRAVLNDPARIVETRRDLVPWLLAGVADAVVPRTVRWEAGRCSAGGLLAHARDHGLEPPFLLRPAGSHGGKALTLAASLHDAAALTPEAGVDHYLTAFVDYRSPDGLFRKYRMMFVDRRPHAYHLAISDHWMVHHETAGMAASPQRRDEERRFLEDPEAVLGARAMAAIRTIGRRLDLDYCGVDFGLLADGRVLVFEANATMLVHEEDPAGPFADKNPHVARICEAFQALLARAAARMA